MALKSSLSLLPLLVIFTSATAIHPNRHHRQRRLEHPYGHFSQHGSSSGSSYVHGELPYVDTEDVPDISPDPWIFESDRLPSVGGTIKLRYMPSVGNGHLATNIYTDTIYVNGLYNGERGYSYRARIPSVHASQFHVEGAANHTRRYSLDVKNAVYKEKIETEKVKVTYSIYAHHFYSRLLITDVTMERHEGQTGPITLNRTSLEGPDTTDIQWMVPKVNITCPVPNDGYTCYFQHGQISIPETNTSLRTHIYMYYSELPASLKLPVSTDNDSWTYVVALDQDNATAFSDFTSVMVEIGDGKSSEVLKKHTDAWENIWNNGRIDIEGDLKLQKIIYGTLYYLYSNLPSEDTSSPTNQFYGLSPGGLPNGKNGSDYYGHVFWDMETWMYPTILMFRPDLAEQMLSYRIKGMDPAFKRATDGGYYGTRFPWESAYSGVEVTPDICPKCRDNQQHITGDIAFAARQYISATRDRNWLDNKHAGTDYTGFNFLQEMARFWWSRPTYNRTKDKYEIDGVMPPDEHAEDVDNSVYTNVMASLAVHFARYAACLSGKNSTDEVPERWLQVVEQLYFPFKSEKRYHEEYEGYDHQVETNTTDPRGIKQADVVLLNFPLMWNMPEDVQRNDLEIYEKVTHPEGPAMTWGMHSIGWLQLDDVTRAEQMFNKSYELYVRQPFKIWTEVQTGLGAVNFLTGMGGFLQALLFGYGGMRLHVEKCEFLMPRLPPGTTRMTFVNLDYLENTFNIEVTLEKVKVTVVTAALDTFPLQLKLKNDATPKNMTDGFTLEFDHQPFEMYTLTQSDCELPRDYIEVDYDPVEPTTQPPTQGCSSLSSTIIGIFMTVLLVTYF